EMLPNGSKEIYSDDNEQGVYWKDEAYQEVKNRNLSLEKEVERLWQMISHLTTGTKPDFERMRDAS
ncbi:MAG: hypothetical protein JNL60_01455, partial [Bacteroidia bacterium]|nr:hypothetical protein [Bacteroidia bacterium]